MGSPFDYPLSQRLDENDAIIMLDKVLVPWENVFAYGDIDKVNNFFPRTGFLPRFVVHGCTRLAGEARLHRGPAARRPWKPPARRISAACRRNVGEVLAWRNMFWGLTDAMVRDPTPWTARLRAAEHRARPRVPRARDHRLLEDQGHRSSKRLARALIYLPSHARDFQNPEIRTVSSTSTCAAPTATTPRTASS